MSSAKWRPICLDLNVLINQHASLQIRKSNQTNEHHFINSS